LFNHSTTANGVSLGYPRFVAFAPSLTSINTIAMDRTYNASHTTTTTLSGKLVKSPARCYNTSTNYFAGRLRDISIVRSFPSNLVVKDASNNILGFTLSRSEATSSYHTALFNYT
jgi:hypothetical protein